MNQSAILRSALLFSAALTMSAPGDIVGPYSADEHTRLLYHFEEAPDDFEKAGDPGNPISNFGSKGSALSLTDTGGPDGRDNKDGGGYAAQGATGMGHAFDVIASGNGRHNITGSTTGGGLRTAQPVPQANLQATDGTFTYEALVKLPDIKHDRQILSLDSSGAVRGFNFRTTADGALAFFGGSGNPDVSARIPTSGEHAFAPGEWFHVAISYDGKPGQADNTKLYWTRFDSRTPRANLLGSGKLTVDLPDSKSHLHVGTTARQPFRYETGLIDEVRVSAIVRGPDDFLFRPGNEPAVRTVEFTVNTSAPTAVIPPQIYGQFMEDFGHAFEGGIHAEKVRGMGFEGNDFTSFWKAFTDDAAEGAAQVVEGSTPSGRKCLAIDVKKGSAGARQERFHLEKGRSYGGSVWVIAEAGEPALSLRIRGAGTVDVPLGTPGQEWKEVPYRFTCKTTDANAVLEIVATGSGRARVDFISLMAEDDRAAAMTRKDLREGVEALRPTFIRFPGGSHASRYHWKDAIGLPHLRPYVLNESWGYHIYNLLGTDEFMNICEHLDAEPMIVFNATDHSTKNLDQRSKTLLNDALDWVRYLTDPPTSKWGAMRAANGRSEPWSVPYFQIDNEPMNFNMGGTAYAKLVNDWSPAIRAAAPKSHIIACGQKRDPDLAFSKQVIDGAGANFQILGVHNYEYTESAYFTGVRRIGNYLRNLRDFIHQSAHPHIKIGVLEWGMSVGKSSMDWRSGIHAAGNLMLYESMSEDITMTCPAVFMRQKGYVRWGYGASLMFDHKTSWPSGGYAVGKLFREHYQPERLAYLEGDVDAIATRSADGKVLVVKAVNYTDRPSKLDLRLTGSQVSADAVVRIREIASSLTAECNAEKPALFEPRESTAKHSGGLVHELAPHSVVVIEFRNP